MNLKSGWLLIIYRCVVSIISLLIAYAMWQALGEDAPGSNAHYLVIGGGALALVLAVAVWSRNIAAVYYQATIIPIFLAMYFFEARQQDPVDALLHIEQLWKLIKESRAAGQGAIIQYSPVNFAQNKDGALTLANGDRVMPLGGVANVPTIMCREGDRPFARYDADEFGFNNPKGIWGKPVDIVLIGDSMVYGACLPNRNHFVAQVRALYPATLNVSDGGIGPLIELAMVREFIPKIRPKYVFYFYDENNDLYFINSPGTPDLRVESQNLILRKYLDDDRFSQNVYERQPQFDAALKENVERIVTKNLSERAARNDLLDFLSAPLIRKGLKPASDAPSPTPLAAPVVENNSPLKHPRVAALGPQLRDAQSALKKRPENGQPVLAEDPRAAASQQFFEKPRLEDFELFKSIFAKTKRVVEESGARFVFVNIPSQGTLCDNVVHPWKKPLLDFVTQSGVDVINLETDFAAALTKFGREAVFAVPPCGGHFSELGYKIIGDRLVEYLNIQNNVAKPETPGQLMALPAGWTYRPYSPESGRTADGRQVVVSRIVSANTKFFETDARLEGPVASMTREQGAAVLNVSYQMRNPGARLRFTARVPLTSANDNEVLAGVFFPGEVKSDETAAAPAKAGGTTTVVVSREIANPPDGNFQIQLRIAARSSGKLTINGSGAGPTSAALQPTMTFEEIKPIGQLFCVGVMATDDEVIQARRRSAVEAQRGWGKIAYVGNIFPKAKLLVNKAFAMEEVSDFKQEYKSYAAVSQIVPRARGLVVNAEGASIMGDSFVPEGGGNVMRVHATVPVWSSNDNALVVAIFKDQDIVASAVRVQDVEAGKVTTVNAEFEVAVPSNTLPRGFEIRIGPAKEGAIFLNGTAAGPSPQVPMPTLVVKEYRPFWR